jgi:uncharacterized membrane protein YphA (DoxX/SURF4 family)
MDIVLWVLRILLALAFLAAGATKLTQPKEKLRERMGWVDDWSSSMVMAIGALEVVGAIGLLVPALTSVAAAGLVVIMIGAVVTHVRRKEIGMIFPPLVLLALCAALSFGAA